MAPRFVFVVRHGARKDKDGAGSMTEYTSSCEPHHEHDTPLSEKGILQAFRTGELIRQCLGTTALATQNILMVSSPLRRCLQTTRGIRRGLLAGTARACPEDPAKADPIELDGEPRCHLEVCTGFFELFVENLFPVAPKHVITPTLDVMLRSGAWEQQGDDDGIAGGDDPPLFQSVAVDDRIGILERYPETKPQSMARSVAALEGALQLGDSGGYDVLVIVAHQFNCHVIASHVVETVARIRDTPGGGGASSGGAARPKGKPRHIDWKKEARRMLGEGAAVRQDEVEGNNGGVHIPIQRDASILDFDVCSVSLFEYNWVADEASTSRVPTPREVHLVAYKAHLEDL